MKTLACILAQTRAWELTYKSFEEFVLKPHGADLCLCVSQKDSLIGNPFYRQAKYFFTYHEPDDYMEAFEHARFIENAPKQWVSILRLKDQLFGGIINPDNQHPGSAGILIFYRWLLLHNLKLHQLISQYDWFIITRSDHLYEFHAGLDLNNRQNIYIPEGEDYGGITDRHIVVSRDFVETVLDLMSPILHDHQNLYNTMKHNEKWNLEQYIKFIFDIRNITSNIVRFPRNMYTVRGLNDSTRWEKGRFVPSKNYYIKYINEFYATQRNKIEEKV